MSETETMSESRKKYLKFVEKNKERIREKIQCECGGHYTYFNKSDHNKSIKHRKHLGLIDEVKKIVKDKELIKKQIETLQLAQKILESKLN